MEYRCTHCQNLFANLVATIHYQRHCRMSAWCEFVRIEPISSDPSLVAFGAVISALETSDDQSNAPTPSILPNEASDPLRSLGGDFGGAGSTGGYDSDSGSSGGSD